MVPSLRKLSRSGYECRECTENWENSPFGLYLFCVVLEGCPFTGKSKVCYVNSLQVV